MTGVLVLGKYVPSWPALATAKRPPEVKRWPLARALTRPYHVDAHFAAYEAAMPFRLNGGALHDLLGMSVNMRLAVFDVDDSAAHAANAPASDEWWGQSVSKLERLLNAHPGAFIYRTRGGMRIVYALDPPVALLGASDADAWKARYQDWCAYLEQRFEIAADPACKDWTRLYRCPHAMRDGAKAPEDRETIGDPHNVGAWALPPDWTPAPHESSNGTGSRYEARDRVPRTQRHADAVAFAGKLRRAGFGAEDIARMLRERRDLHYDDPGSMPDRELAEVAGWVETKRPAEPAPDATAPPSPLTCMVSLRQAAARPRVEQPSVWKGGGLPLGYYGVAHGPGGIGKTKDKGRMIALRLLGRNWHGWEASDEPFRPIVLSLEIDTAAFTAIAKDTADALGPGTWDVIANRVGLLGAPDFVEQFHAGPGATIALLEMIDGASARLGLDWAPEPANYVLIDSFGELKEDPSDKPEAYASGIAMLKHVARARHACLDVIHHNRRLPPGASKPSSPADDFRGPATFLNASRFACAYDEHYDKRRVTWHRVSFGPRPADSYFVLSEHGVPLEEAAPPPPAAVSDANRQTVLDTLVTLSRASGFAGASKAVIWEAMPLNSKTGKRLSDDTVFRKLGELEAGQLVRRSGQGRAVVYFPGDGITASPQDHRNEGCGDD